MLSRTIATLHVCSHYFRWIQITSEKTPKLAKAARVTIERRAKQKNWEDVEWTRVNIMHFYARLTDGEAAHEQLIGLLSKDTERILMTFSRAGVAGAEENSFAIDGNTGGNSGIAEMLLQSQRCHSFASRLTEGVDERLN